MSFAIAPDQLMFTNTVINSAQLVSTTNQGKSVSVQTQVTIDYPQLTLAPQTTTAQQFNNQVKTIIDKEIAEFRKNVQELNQYVPKEQQTAAHNSLRITYNITARGQSEKPLVSVLFTVESNIAASARPNISHQTLNFDFKTGGALQLSQLFKPGSNYLAFLNDYCAKELSEKAHQPAADLKQSGTLKYDHWNLSPLGLLVTFDDFPHALGPMSVVVPYTEIKSEVLPQRWTELTQLK